MPNWRELKHAYGSAEDIPEIISALTPDPVSPVLGRLVEPGLPSGNDIFRKSSSLAISAQHLFQLEHHRPRHAAGASWINRCSATNDSRWVRRNCGGLRRLALETVKNPELPRVDRIYVMQSVLGLQGNRLWGTVLDHLSDGEFPALCTACRKELYLVIGKHGVFVTSADWVHEPTVVKTEIKPLEADTMTGVAKWLHTVSVQSNDLELSNWVRYLFGSSKCPECREPFNLPEAIAAVESNSLKYPNS